MLIGLCLVGVVFILPEAAAEDGCLVGIHYAHAHAAQLGIAAAGNHRSAFCQTGLRCALGIHMGNHGAALGNLGEDAGFQADAGGNPVVPVPLLQIEDAGGTGVGGFGGEYTGHLINEPVIEHGAHGGFFIHLGHFVLHPEQPGQRTQGIGLTGLPVNLFFQLRVHVNQLCHLVIAAGIHVGAGPNFLPLLVIQHDALPHTGGGNGSNLPGIHAGLLNHAPDTAACQIPVVNPVKIHAAGIAGVLFVGPFLLNAAQLLAFQAKQHRTHAAGACIHSHKRFCHFESSFQETVCWEIRQGRSAALSGRIDLRRTGSAPLPAGKGHE